MLEYVGRKFDLAKVDINSTSYESFIRDIENGVNCKFQKLYFKIPGKSLEDGLTYIWNDKRVVLIFTYLHYGLIKAYGENFKASETSEGES